MKPKFRYYDIFLELKLVFFVVFFKSRKNPQTQSNEYNKLTQRMKPQLTCIVMTWLFSDKIKLALHIESIEWKRILGKLLSQAYKERVLKLMQFIKDRMKTMSKKIKDLDDVRVAMLCLEMIREEFIG